MSNWHESCRVARFEDGSQKLRAIRESLGAEEDFRDEQSPIRPSVERADTHASQPSVKADSGSNAPQRAIPDPSPAPEPVKKMCVVGASVYMTHKLNWSTARCSRCNHEYPKIELR
jgi:hypothetical protein